MAGHKKRKYVSIEESSNKQPSSSGTRQGIKAYGTVGKPNASNDSLKKRKMVHTREPTPPPAPQVLPINTEKKRKRGLETVDEEDAEAITVTPRNKRFKNLQQPSPTETPSKSTATLFGNLKLEPAPKAIPFTLKTNQPAYTTPPDSPDADDDGASLPSEEVKHLVALNAAFLSSLSMYYAHNGTSSTVNVKVLLHMITKSWKKRIVSLDDLRMLLAIQEDGSKFILEDFGRAGVCLTKLEPRGRAIKRSASFVDEVDLNIRFEEALRKKWSNWLAVTSKENRTVATFLDQLPLVEIERSATVDKAASLHTRGQERLADLRTSQAASTSSPITPPAIGPKQKTDEAVQNRGMSLLDRIVAKQTLTSSLPGGPTKEQLERKAALHRVEDIARVLDLLAAGRSRCSFSMPVMVQQLQQSLRNPISKEEVGRCLDVTNEIMPSFVSLVRSGSVTGVIVTRNGRIGAEELRQRVQDAVA